MASGINVAYWVLQRGSGNRNEFGNAFFSYFIKNLIRCKSWSVLHLQQTTVSHQIGNIDLPATAKHLQNYIITFIAFGLVWFTDVSQNTFIAPDQEVWVFLVLSKYRTDYCCMLTVKAILKCKQQLSQLITNCLKNTHTQIIQN